MFEFEQLHRELIKCFGACGIHDVWTSDSVACTIEEHLIRQGQNGNAPMAEDELHALVCSVLLAAGYHDVANRYRQLRDSGPNRAAGPGVAPWDRVRLTDMIRRSHPLTQEAEQTLTTLVGNALQRLGFSVASDELIRQLAAHLLDMGMDSGSDRHASPWLFGPDQVNSISLASVLTPTYADAVRFHPVSRLVPRVRAELDLVRLVESLGTPPMTEMMVLPAIRRTLCRLRVSLSELWERLCRERAEAHHHPAHLIVRGLGLVLADHLVPLARRQEKALIGEIDGLVKKDLADELDFELVISYRQS